MSSWEFSSFLRFFFRFRWVRQKLKVRKLCNVSKNARWIVGCFELRNEPLNSCDAWWFKFFVLPLVAVVVPFTNNIKNVTEVWFLLNWRKKKMFVLLWLVYRCEYIYSDATVFHEQSKREKDNSNIENLVNKKADGKRKENATTMNKHDDRKGLLRHVKYSRNRCSQPLKHTSKSVFANASSSLPTATRAERCARQRNYGCCCFWCCCHFGWVVTLIARRARSKPYPFLPFCFSVVCCSLSLRSPDENVSLVFSPPLSLSLFVVVLFIFITVLCRLCKMITHKMHDMAKYQ